MRKHVYGEYALTLVDTGETDGHGKHRVAYKLEDGDGVIFQGRDFFNPGGLPEGIESAASLLSFLVMVEGDVEPDYFADYDPRQIRFRDYEADDLACWQADLEGEGLRESLAEQAKRRKERSHAH